ncbi:MAG TPA: hypothetical protein DDZ55_11520 [Firmicutes bacterium]|nr:hypothetical protein [Bacillota bacterium]
MIYFITGQVNQGKSSKLRSIYQEQRTGDGFYNRKLIRNGVFVGQELVRLTSGESRIFSYRTGFIPEDWEAGAAYRDFSFSEAGLAFGCQIIWATLAERIEPIYLDELGPLELAGNGFAHVFRETLCAGIEAYVVVRSSCLQSVIDTFAVTEYQIIPSSEGVNQRFFS